MTTAPSSPSVFSWSDFIRDFCMGFLLFGGIPVGIVLLLNYVNLPLIALIVAGLAVTVMALLTLGVRVTSHGELHQKRLAGELDTELGMVLACFLSVVLLFSLVNKEIHVNYPTQFSGTPITELPLWTWLLYTLDNFAECVLFDVPSIYDLHFTAIKPIAGVSRFVALSFRLTIDLFIIASIIHYFQFLRALGKPESVATNA